MATYKIQIKGIVQGVGFRPRVYKLAGIKAIKGKIANDFEGVRIIFNCNNLNAAKDFMQYIIDNAPHLSRIQSAELTEIKNENFDHFFIEKSRNKGKPDIIISPDFAICQDCKEEIENPLNRRYKYAFTTCTNCGPRYSIISNIPYDRPNTTMSSYIMCPECSEEYMDPQNRRHFSQTNSCPKCGIKLKIYNSDQGLIKDINEGDEIDFMSSKLKEGQILAVKGIGGYLLICDAQNDSTVELLRKRKLRAHKSFALMYPDLNSVINNFKISDSECNAIQSPEAPILLLKPKSNINLSKSIAADSSVHGVMLPYAPLFNLISQKFKNPILATSGNITGSPIIYEDEVALNDLSEIADYIVTNNREILIPQDDSLIQYSPKHKKRIILRRSRGIAPNFFNNSYSLGSIEGFLALGAEMKGTFAFVNKGNIFISQYLGSMENYYSQLSYEKVLSHLSQALNFSPVKILSDLHPNYFSNLKSKELSLQHSKPREDFQHHKAHFASVLSENDLLNSEESILGFIWDGTGLSEEGQIWGSETFVYGNYEIVHLANMGYVKNISADQMSLQPRLSLMAFIDNPDEQDKYLKHLFSSEEWKIYHQLKEKSTLKSSSMGRLIDAVSCLLTGIETTTYEGQAALKLETLAYLGTENTGLYKKSIEISPNHSLNEQVMDFIIESLEKGYDKSWIAYKFHELLIDWIKIQASKYEIKRLAFSGGVFQNGLLVDLIVDRLSKDFELYFHRELSPNDENIAHGQLMLAYLNQRKSGIE